jgi:virginiamycin B lyase
MNIHATLLSTVILMAAQASAQSQTANVAWGINSQRQVWHLNASGWNLVPGPGGAVLAEVSAAADGTVWAVDTGNNIYSYTGSGWQAVQGQLGQVAVGSAKNVWGVNTQTKTVWHWDGSQWTPINSWAQQVSVASDGTVWAIDPAGFPYMYTGAAGWPWQAVGGQLTQVSAGGSNNVWGVNSNNVWQWDGIQWNPRPGTMSQVSVGPDGTVYALDLSGKVYTWSGSTWQPMSGSLSQISAGLCDRIAYNNSAISTQGAWFKQTSSNASAGAYLQDSTAGDALSLTFTGDSIALYRLLDPNGGQVTATVDGNPAGYIDFYFSQQRWQIPAVLDHLGAGQHTLVLTVSSQANSASAGHNVYIDSFAVPAPFVANVDQQTALTRLNFYRAQAGLPAASLTKGINLSAQALADYNAINNTQVHVEDPSLPDFVGAQFTDRQLYFGYDSAASETIHNFEAAASVDDWMAMVYHRISLLTYSYTDIGSGLSRLNNNLRTVMDFGNKRLGPPAARLLSTYPSNGQINVPLVFSPDGTGVPQGITVAGYPVSLQITQPTNPPQGASAASTTYQLADSSGNPVPIYPPTGANLQMPADIFVMLPQQPLTPNTTYQAHITGTDSQGNPFDVAWAFTTLPNAGVAGTVSFGATANSVNIQWVTGGPVTSAQLVYGLTTAYGMQGPAPFPNNPANPYSVVAQLTGLNPGATYHYQITTTDAQGHTWTTPDATFVTAPASPQ